MRPPLILLAGAVFAVQANAGELEFSGYVGADATYFPETGFSAGQLAHFQGGLLARPELKWTTEERDTLLKFAAFGRLDSADTDRSHFDIREAFVFHDFGELETLAGINKVFWGVTESRQLVDIINQRDALEYNDRDARLGQPMVQLTTRQDWGELSFFAMTGFRKVQFPGDNGRFLLPLPIDEGAAVFEDSAEEWAPDFAARYSNTFGNLDVGVSAFHGTSREPRLVLDGAGTAYIPYYDRITQGGLEVQYTWDALLLKFEGIVREGQGDTFGALVTGAEYTLSQIAGTDGDLGLIGEYLYDGRTVFHPFTPYDNDVFLGLRYAANDERDTSALLGSAIDLDDGSMAIRAEFETRIAEGFTLDADAQFFVPHGSNSDLKPLENDGFISVTIKRHF
ncbi:hypothetical protein K1718_00240 [Roseibium porphyridii]|uniref:Porin n=1 Tax=Roseibium porphyridii TaxID=2866279 RepID=A0ABY8F9A6_9HYPH|nr:hypothetical protein [Roseibium sp. KMA01]WFE89825.1 hypothetical protein K1718_00240 [Roseibium sp. KMA01]